MLDQRPNFAVVVSVNHNSCALGFSKTNDCPITIHCSCPLYVCVHIFDICASTLYARTYAQRGLCTRRSGPALSKFLQYMIAHIIGQALICTRLLIHTTSYSGVFSVNGKHMHLTRNKCVYIMQAYTSHPWCGFNLDLCVNTHKVTAGSLHYE